MLEGVVIRNKCGESKDRGTEKVASINKSNFELSPLIV